MKKEIVHFCKEDNENYTKTSPLFGLSSILISENDTRLSIKQITPNMSCGPDGIPGILLRNCMDALASPLTEFWNLSMKMGKIPKRLKSAFVLPFLKSGSNKNIPSSYRPISQTSQLMKLHERSVKRFLQSYLEKGELINDFQYGFREKRSCLAQLLNFYNEILTNIEEGNNNDVIYLDFQKVFDVVDWGVLCHRMRDKGIDGEIAVWIHDFLTDRTQQILVNDTLSSISQVTSGVPQGTVLGPLLFLVLIDSLGDAEIDALMTAFADDSKIAQKITDENDALKLQEDMEQIYTWQENSNMKFNVTKFHTLKFRRNQGLKTQYNYFGPQ